MGLRFQWLHLAKQPPCGTLNVLWVVSVIFLACLSSCAGQMKSPLHGQGVNPQGRFPSDANQENYTTVYVSCLLDKLMKVYETRYGFEAVVYTRLIWADNRALPEILRRTDESSMGGRPCSRVCEDPRGQCCDTVWLPSFMVTNIEDYPQDRIDYSTVSAIQRNGTTYVEWIVRFNGRFYCPMNFRRFPFDKQTLFINMWSDDFLVAVEASSAGTELLGTATGPFRADGNNLPDWKVTNLEITPTFFSLDGILKKVSDSNPNEVLPLKRPGLSFPPDPGARPDSFVVRIEVERLWRYQVFSFVLPVVLCVALSWPSFVVSPRNIETRLSLLVSLFLSLTALQFVLSGNIPQSSYITKIGWIVIVAYLFLFLTVVETLVVYSVYRWYVPLEAEWNSALRSHGAESVSVSHTDSMQELKPEVVEDLAPPAEAAHREALHNSQDGQQQQETGEGHSSPQGVGPMRSLPNLASGMDKLREAVHQGLFKPFSIRHIKRELQRDYENALRFTTLIESICSIAFPILYIMSMVFIIAV